MPRRKLFFANGEFYHVFNRSTASRPIFKGGREKDVFLEAARFYLQEKPPTRYSIFRKSRLAYPIDLSKRIVTIVNYCIMPNHFHFTLRQEKDDGVRQFVQKISNSFAHYFSILNKSRGHIFEDAFKAVHIEDEGQLFHLTRYIHLNPVTSYIVERPEDYEYSSYNIYIGNKESDLIDSSFIMNSFKSVEKYKEFVMAQKDYQRSLDEIKHLLLE